MGYVSGQEHALVDTQLFLPKDWTTDKERCKKAGIPKPVRFHTRHQLCLKMLEQHGDQLPHSWITGDAEIGRPYWFRRHLNTLDERYLLAVDTDTNVRDLEADLPAYSGRGRKPKRPWMRADQWAGALEEEDWTRVDVRDGAKGPLIVEVVKRRVVARTEKRQEGHEEVFVVLRYKDRDDQRVLKTDYYLSNASCDTSNATFARAAKAEHRIEECIQRAKSEAGLADYEVRNWIGWQHHQILSLIATWFLITEASRGKKMDASTHGSPNQGRHQFDTPSRLQMRYHLPYHSRAATTTQTQ
jgi:SRSO17 transposase